MMTILRKTEHAALASIVLTGKVLDLGGDKRSKYISCIKGNFSVTTANMDAKTSPDILCDLEKPLSVADASYDAVLLINVLEHIFEYRQLLNESARVLKNAGTAVIIVPFLFPVHGSPNDFHRYTASGLERALFASGFLSVSIMPLGTGVCAARWSLIERLLPFPLSFLSYIARPLSIVGDFVLKRLAQLFNKKYNSSNYALGYMATAKK